jgi:hypothetical protein
MTPLNQERPRSDYRLQNHDRVDGDVILTEADPHQVLRLHPIHEDNIPVVKDVESHMSPRRIDVVRPYSENLLQTVVVAGEQFQYWQLTADDAPNFARVQLERFPCLLQQLIHCLHLSYTVVRHGNKKRVVGEEREAVGFVGMKTDG